MGFKLCLVSLGRVFRLAEITGCTLGELSIIAG